MTILTRYILREFSRTLFLALGFMMGLFVVIDFFEKIDEFVIYKASAAQCLSYYFYKLPLVGFLMAPVAFLLSTVITIGALSRNSELTAMKSCGLSLMRLTGPILSASLCLAVMTLVGNEFIIPFTTQKANAIFHEDIRKERPVQVYQRDKIWFRSNDGSIWRIGFFDAQKQEMRDVAVFRYEGTANLRERVDAQSVVWKEGSWVFQNGAVRSFGESGTGAVEPFETQKIYFPAVPDDFIKNRKRTEEMTLRELYDYAQKVKKEGMDNAKNLVDFHHKMSYPFISLVTALIGIPFSLRSARSGGVIFCVGLSIVLGFSYYFVFSFGISLGHGGTLPPVMAAWGPNLFFVAAGLYFILAIDSETFLPSFSFGKKSPVRGFKKKVPIHHKDTKNTK